MTYTTTIYRELRRRGEGARFALRVARIDAAASAAGIDRFPQYTDGDPVTIDGREYRLTVEPDQDGWWFGEDDVTGRVIERGREWYTGHPSPVEPPAIALDEHYAYQPADYYDPAEQLAWRRRTMSRHAAWLAARDDLLREAAPHVRERDYGESRCWGVTLTDDTGDSESLWGVELGDDFYDRCYVYDVVSDLAAELEYRRIVAAMRVGEKLAAATCHG